MRIKSLFTVPEGTKVTEKAFSKVLLSSICSILLCMACLMSTTWAWFQVELDNKDNVIQIAEVDTGVTIKKGDTSGTVVVPESDGSYKLDQGSYTVTITVTSDGSREDSFGVKNVYMTMSVSAASSGTSTASDDPAQTPSSEAPVSDISGIYMFCMEFGAANEAGKRTAERQITLNVPTDGTKVSFGRSWVQPDNAEPVKPETTEIGDKIVAEIDDTTDTEEQEKQDTNTSDNGENSEGGDTSDNGEAPEGDVSSGTGTETPSDTETEKTESTT